MRAFGIGELGIINCGMSVDGKPHPKLSEIAGKYLTGEISRKENQEQTMAAVRTLEQEKKEGKF